MNYRSFSVQVAFFDAGVEYGRETYKVMAADTDQAETKARTNASASVHDDPSRTERKIKILAVTLN